MNKWKNTDQLKDRMLTSSLKRNVLGKNIDAILENFIWPKFLVEIPKTNI